MPLARLFLSAAALLNFESAYVFHPRLPLALDGPLRPQFEYKHLNIPQLSEIEIAFSLSKPPTGSFNSSCSFAKTALAQRLFILKLRGKIWPTAGRGCNDARMPDEFGLKIQSSMM